MENRIAWNPAGDDDVERALLDFVQRKVVADGEGVGRDEHLIESGRVDSIGLIQLLGFVAERWAVDLLRLGSPGDLQSVAALAAAIRRESGVHGCGAAGSA